MATAQPRRRCVICRRWYRALPNIGARQKTCRGPECQKELHRRNCADYHDRERSGERRDQLRSRIRGDNAAAQVSTESVAPLPPEMSTGALPGLDWNAVESYFGLEQTVMWEEVVRALVYYLLGLMTSGGGKRRGQTGRPKAARGPDG